MTAITPTLTQAGLQAVFNATNTGLAAEITHIALGESGYTPTDTATALVDEKQRVAISGGELIGTNQIHLTATADGAAEYWIREVGFYLSDGTLLAVYSDPTNPIAHKSTSLDILLSFDLVLSALPPSAVTINGTGGLSFPTATNTKQGIMRYATDLEAASRADVNAAVKPSQLSAATHVRASTTTAGIVEKAVSSEVTAGTVDKFIDAALLKAAIDALRAELDLNDTFDVIKIRINTSGLLPPGHIALDGAAYSRTLYPILFLHWGTKYGAGDGLTTFNVPNWSNRFLRHTNFPNLMGTLQGQDIQSHHHAIVNVNNVGPIMGHFPYGDRGDGSIFDTNVTSATGGVETRPVNFWFTASVKGE